MAAIEEENPMNTELVASEEEEAENERAAKTHRRLVDVLSALAGAKRRRAVERTEASGQISEFDVGGGGADEKVILSELLQPISSSPALGSFRKQLKKAQQKKAVQLPLSKEESERVVREAAYTQTSQALAKWDPVVQQNRRAEQLVFPLQQERVTVAAVEEVMSGWQARTPLEEEIFSLLHKAKQPVKDPLLTPQEKASLQAMSLEEARLRRMELQRARALQSYYEAKARRERKIKSKKYHKVLRKGKSRKVLQEFEMLRTSNPEAALEQLEKMEKARIEERMSLKHQNKGRWAKSTVLMAKYDLEARQAMQEQLARNKELTQKVHPAASDSEEGGNDSEAEGGLVPDVVNEGHAGVDPDNPWMLGKPHAESKEDPPASAENSGESEGEEGPPVTEEEVLLQGFVERRQSQGPSGEESISVVPDVLPPAPPSPVPEGPFLAEKLERLRTLEDMEALEPEEDPQEDKTPRSKDAELQQPLETEASGQPKGGKTQISKKSAKHKALIDLKAVLAGPSHATHCPLVPSTVQDELETGTDQRRVIQEAFASDNVVADFMKEKRRAEQASKPKAISLVLPGWGEWGGTGLRPSIKKRRRFLIEPATGPPRRDRHLPHIILSEQRNILAAAHQVNQLPFPFENSQQFERSIQAPVGPTWNTQRAFQRLTAPHIVTQPGHIIRPISAEDSELIRQADNAKATGQKPDLALSSSPRKRRPCRASKKKAQYN
ncbi:U3 small nucleolar RNA-associated protein 14 homolog A [Rhineura floridana]|uniref:U3 small nucleolar RNA-associated protein 14 homolog A n=1 Tax=Rhineura floridana TaxID=261503 RepID=UPI002AC8566D|nr:U3 small nucleolar RNA-associated protein 14 homolog A [Rhineura floridana]XP_061454907.1 U3 small nucleolar RNA-associated protein 14 homolog A [Rhineura floridana]